MWYPLELLLQLPVTAINIGGPSFDFGLGAAFLDIYRQTSSYFMAFAYEHFGIIISALAILYIIVVLNCLVLTVFDDYEAYKHAKRQAAVYRSVTPYSANTIDDHTIFWAAWDAGTFCLRALFAGCSFVLVAMFAIIVTVIRAFVRHVLRPVGALVARSATFASKCATLVCRWTAYILLVGLEDVRCRAVMVCGWFMLHVKAASTRARPEGLSTAVAIRAALPVDVVHTILARRDAVRVPMHLNRLNNDNILSLPMASSFGQLALVQYLGLGPLVATACAQSPMVPYTGTQLRTSSVTWTFYRFLRACDLPKALSSVLGLRSSTARLFLCGMVYLDLVTQSSMVRLTVFHLDGHILDLTLGAYVGAITGNGLKSSMALISPVVRHIRTLVRRKTSLSVSPSTFFGASTFAVVRCSIRKPLRIMAAPGLKGSAQAFQLNVDLATFGSENIARVHPIMQLTAIRDSRIAENSTRDGSLERTRAWFELLVVEAPPTVPYGPHRASESSCAPDPMVLVTNVLSGRFQPSELLSAFAYRYYGIRKVEALFRSHEILVAFDGEDIVINVHTYQALPKAIDAPCGNVLRALPSTTITEASDMEDAEDLDRTLCESESENLSYTTKDTKYDECDTWDVYDEEFLLEECGTEDSLTGLVRSMSYSALDHLLLDDAEPLILDLDLDLDSCQFDHPSVGDTTLSAPKDTLHEVLRGFQTAPKWTGSDPLASHLLGLQGASCGRGEDGTVSSRPGRYGYPTPCFSMSAVARPPQPSPSQRTLPSASTSTTSTTAPYNRAPTSTGAQLAQPIQESPAKKSRPRKRGSKKSAQGPAAAEPTQTSASAGSRAQAPTTSKPPPAAQSSASTARPTQPSASTSMSTPVAQPSASTSTSPAPTSEPSTGEEPRKKTTRGPRTPTGERRKRRKEREAAEAAQAQAAAASHSRSSAGRATTA